MNAHKLPFDELLRPETLSEFCLPERLRRHMERFLSSGSVMNLTFYGRPGIGKTSAARLIAKQFDWLSFSGTDKTIVSQVTNFASSVSFNGKHKVCIIDEADGMPKSMQMALGYKIDEFFNNCRFLLTTNDLSGLSEALQSRCTPLCFNLSRDELKEVKEQSYGFYARRLEELELPFEGDKLRQIVEQHLPHHRAIAKQIELEFGMPPENQGEQS